MSLGHGLEVWCGSLAPGSFLYLQNQQWWFESLLYHVTPTYIRPPSSTFKGPCDFIRLTQIIQDNLYQDFCGHCACCGHCVCCPALLMFLSEKVQPHDVLGTQGRWDCIRQVGAGLSVQGRLASLAQRPWSLTSTHHGPDSCHDYDSWVLCSNLFLVSHLTCLSGSHHPLSGLLQLGTTWISLQTSSLPMDVPNWFF